MFNDKMQEIKTRENNETVEATPLGHNTLRRCPNVEERIHPDCIGFIFFLTSTSSL